MSSRQQFDKQVHMYMASRQQFDKQVHLYMSSRQQFDRQVHLYMSSRQQFDKQVHLYMSSRQQFVKQVHMYILSTEAGNNWTTTLATLHVLCYISCNNISVPTITNVHCVNVTKIPQFKLHK